MHGESLHRSDKGRKGWNSAPYPRLLVSGRSLPPKASVACAQRLKSRGAVRPLPEATMTLTDWILSAAVLLLLLVASFVSVRRKQYAPPPLSIPTPTPAHPPGRPTSIGGHESIFSFVDEALEKMEIGNVAFNSPSPINVDDYAKVELRLDLRLPPATLVKMVGARGVVEYASIKVSNRMTAHLSGFQFDITATTPETQAVSGRESTIWMWTVKPNTAGECDLHLDLRALIDVDGSREERTIETFSRTIHVIVTPGQRVAKFAKEHWKWLCGTLLIPFAGWLWKLYH